MTGLHVLGYTLLAGASLLGAAAAGSAQEPAFGAFSIDELRSQAAAMKGVETAPPADRKGFSEHAITAATAYPYALLSSDAYSDRVEDWCELLERRQDERTGFSGYACRKHRDGRVVVAFRGTDEFKDWVKADIPQAVSLPEHYREGCGFAEDMKARYGDIVVTGHSLGGGIAQYAALKLGLEAWTFNPAGIGLGVEHQIMKCVSDGTCRPDSSRITNVIVAGEPLAAARFFVGPDFVRLRGSVVHFLPAGGGLSSHSMASVRAALEAAQR